MTPEEIKAAREFLGLSQRGLAWALYMGANGERQVRRWESGETPISGPAEVALHCLRYHDLPVDSPEEMEAAERRYLARQREASIPLGGGIIRPGTKGIVRVSKPGPLPPPKDPS